MMYLYINMLCECRIDSCEEELLRLQGQGEASLSTVETEGEDSPYYYDYGESGNELATLMMRNSYVFSVKDHQDHALDLEASFER